MKPLKKSSAQMVADARSRITEIETPALISILDDPNVLIVDIRDVRERQRSGFIPGSFHAPRGMIEFWIDPQSPTSRTFSLKTVISFFTAHQAGDQR